MKPRVLIPLGAILLLVSILFFVWPLIFSGAARVWIVSPNGRGDSCSLFSPCDLFTAQSQAREAKVKGDALIYLRGGTYSLAETWNLTASDSGKDGHWTIVRAYPGETPVLSGGGVVDGWEKGPEGVYSAAWDGASFASSTRTAGAWCAPARRTVPMTPTWDPICARSPGAS